MRRNELPDIKRFVFSDLYIPLFKSNGTRYTIMTGGRGSGKSYALASFANEFICFTGQKQNILYLRKTLTSAAISIIPEFMEKLELMGFENLVKTTRGEIVSKKSGSQIFFRGIQSSSKSNEANLKSIPNIGVIILDEAQELDDEPTFDRLDLSLRSKEIQNRVILSMNPTHESHWICRRFFRDRGVPEDFNGWYKNTTYIHTDFRDNAHNLSDDFLSLAKECEETNLEKFRNIYLGFWRRDNAAGLWKRETMIDPHRVTDYPELERVVVAVDPAVTANENSDETGIVIAGSALNRQTGETEYYVIEDRSMKGTVNEWAREAIELYDDYDADRLVAEVNNGGDLVGTVLYRIDPSLSFKAVRAKRGKILRAEPISALYERGLVHHVGHFPQLEDEMCNYTGKTDEDSPDRLDALVWALTELSEGAHEVSGGGADGLLG